MLYRRIKKNGDDLSILGFGCMRLPQKRGRPGHGKIDEVRAETQLLYAVDQGINYFDTAVPYHNGASELFLGKVFSGDYRDRVRLATKLFHFIINEPQDMEVMLNAQLIKLNTDRIDYYLLHALERKSWDKLKALGVLEFLEKAKGQGRIVNTGFSFHGDRETFKEIIDAYDWEICQIQFNYLDEHYQAGREGLKYAASKDIGVIIMEPLRGGKLTLKVPPEVKRIWKQADSRRTPAEWALRWIWNHPEVSVVLSGMNDEAHIEENVRIASEAYPNSLQKDELELVNRVKKKYKEIMKVGCTGCNYCMPCPSGVDIPTCFDAYNNAYMFGTVWESRMWYVYTTSGILGTPAKASLCEECGECEDACPQHLPIRESLRKVSHELEGMWFKPAAWVAGRVLWIMKWKVFRRAKKGR